jgi:outer membrane protein assembly factor BamB
MVMIRSGTALIILWASFTALVASDWPQWRGADRSGLSKETGLLQEWPKEGPTLRWKATELGTGYSSPTIVDGRIYLQSTSGQQELALCLDEKTGQKLWSTTFGTVGKNEGPQYPGTRSSATVDGNSLYCLASNGELACLDCSNGSLKWVKNLRKDFDGKPGMWAYAESVLIDGEQLICTPGGTTATLVALNKATGEVIWKCPVPGGDNAEYASIMTVQSGPHRQYVQFLRKGVVGVDAKTGKFLWCYTNTVSPDQGANILTPVVSGNRIFTSGPRTGGGVVEIQPDGDGSKANEVYFNKSITPSIGGAVLVEGHLYCTTSQTLLCVDFATGKVKWTERSVGPASICYADGRLYVRGHNTGETALVVPSPEKYQEKGRLKQIERSKIQGWPHPVVANGGLYLRDQDVLLCYEVGAAKTGR